MTATASGNRIRGLAIPGGLVHPHVHLDKCYLLDRTPIEDGSFEEAMERTAAAKAAFTDDDVYMRGKRLIETSLKHGVLAMRAHVEVDPAVGLKCVEAGRRLKEDFEELCDIQLVAFAQDPLHYPDDGKKQEKMLQLLVEACQMTDVAVVGSAPYVESARPPASGQKTSNAQAQRENIRVVFDLAQQFAKDVDFHLDYNLDPHTEPMLWYIFEEAHRRKFARHICIGHATRMSLFSSSEWDRVERLCRDLKITFVGLPPSDLYMQGRGVPYASRSRATLPMLECVSRFIPAALGVNNVCNLFTPQGDGDPLSLLPLAVGLWQSAEPNTLAAILSMVSTSAHSIVQPALILQPPCYVEVLVDDKGLIREVFEISSGTDAIEEAEQTRRSLDFNSFTLLPNCATTRDAVLSPPSARMAVRNGKVVAWRRIDEGIVEGRSRHVNRAH